LLLSVGVGEDLDPSIDEVHDPVLGHAGRGIRVRLARPVVGQAGLRGLDHREHLVRARVSMPVAIRDRLAQCHIRLGLFPVVEHDRLLYAHHRGGAEPLDQQVHEPVDRGRMGSELGAHRDNLAVEQLDALFQEEPSFTRAMVLFAREAVSGGSGDGA
jgi:hypothetical protein